MALDGDVQGTKSILQSSKNAASDPGYEMLHPWYRVTQLLTVQTDQVTHYEQQNSNKTFGECRSGWNPRTHDECDLESEKGERKGTRIKDNDDKKKGVCNKCSEGGDSASNCLKERESSNASYIGGGDPHCLTCTDDQFHWITTMGKVGLVVEQSNITEFLLDSGAACRVRPCRVTAGIPVMHS